MAGLGVKVQIETKGLAELGDPARIKRAEVAMVGAALAVVFGQAKGDAPGKGAKYLKSFLDHNGPVGHVRAGFPLPFLITGTRAHVIEPKRGRGGRPARLKRFKTESGVIVTRARGSLAAVRFNWQGGERFFKYVHHKGVKANPFMARAAQSADPRAGAAADHALQSILNETR